MAWQPSVRSWQTRKAGAWARRRGARTPTSTPFTGCNTAQARAPRCAPEACQRSITVTAAHRVLAAGRSPPVTTRAFPSGPRETALVRTVEFARLSACQRRHFWRCRQRTGRLPKTLDARPADRWDCPAASASKQSAILHTAWIGLSALPSLGRSLRDGNGLTRSCRMAALVPFRAGFSSAWQQYCHQLVERPLATKIATGAPGGTRPAARFRSGGRRSGCTCLRLARGRTCPCKPQLSWAPFELRPRLCRLAAQQAHLPAFITARPAHVRPGPRRRGRHAAG